MKYREFHENSEYQFASYKKIFFIFLEILKSQFASREKFYLKSYDFTANSESQFASHNKFYLKFDNLIEYPESQFASHNKIVS